VKRHLLILLFLLGACFSLATALQPATSGLHNRRRSGGVLEVLFGDGRRLFANHFFAKADAAYHSGYYPSIFDQRSTNKADLLAATGEHGHEDAEHEQHADFLGPPRDWIEQFGRHFLITEHTHLQAGREREVLPWLRLSAELDPQRVSTYTDAAYLLRSHLGKVKEAEDFLREGLRNNPSSFEILFELGRLEFENHHDPVRARRLWEQALRRWQNQESNKKEPNFFALEGITINLARLEADAGNYERALNYFEAAKRLSPNPNVIQQQIDELKRKTSGPTNSAPKPH
jgi:tetratricopeptide (TPR) repeat protein